MGQLLRHALIVDDNSGRAENIADVLRTSGVECVVRSSIVCKSGQGCHPSNLADVPLETVDLLFLHLGPSESEQISDTSNEYGNECCLEFYLHNRNALEGKCVVAYTGGVRREPKQFQTHKKAAWHQFFPQVLSGKELNLRVFIADWRNSPAAPPPFGVLESGQEFVAAFEILIAGFQTAHSAREYSSGTRHLDTMSKAWTEALAWWAPVLGKNFKGELLLEELGKIGGAEELSRLATRLVSWAASVSTVGQERGSTTIGKELSEALCKLRLWVPPKRC